MLGFCLPFMAKIYIQEAPSLPRFDLVPGKDRDLDRFAFTFWHTMLATTIFPEGYRSSFVMISGSNEPRSPMEIF